MVRTLLLCIVGAPKFIWTFRDSETAGGGPSFKKYTSNPIFELKVTAQLQVKCVGLPRI